MSAIEPLCLGIVLLYVVLRARAEPRVLLRLAALAVAAWIGEDTCVRAYGFYSYTSSPADGPWRLWLDVVPVVVVLTWPVVIHSAWELARALGRSPLRLKRVVAVTGAVVLADAALIEPVSVQAGLWSWTELGPWGVPLIGVLGWGAFAALAVLPLEALVRTPPASETEGGPSPRARWPIYLALALLPGLAVHLPLVLSWWMGFRYLPSPGQGLTLGAGAGLSLAACLGTTRVSRDLRPQLIWLRGPGALFFFALLLWKAPRPSLLAWASLAGLPYALLLWRTRVGGRGAGPAAAANPSAPGNDRDPEGA